MKQNIDNSSFSLLPDAGGYDPIEDRLRANVRATIEAMFEEELADFLGRLRYGRGNERAKGYRHGHRDRQLTGTFGTETVRVPRARIENEAGKITEWRSKALPRYRRLTKKAEALIAAVYLAGTNTRRVKRALFGLFEGAVSKDVVSRAWRKVKVDWDAWSTRDLAKEDIVRLILDGTVIKTRLDRKATNISVLAAIGVRRDGQKVLLSIRNMGGESTAAWSQFLSDLDARGLPRPEFVIVDGAPGLEAALVALWGEDLPIQRCTVHKHRNLTTAEFRNLAGRAGRPGAARGIEGMTLVALPSQISTTAAASRPIQRRQRAELAADYDRLRASLVIEEREADDVASPLALLMHRIWERAHQLLGVAPDAFVDWLERTGPTTVSPDAGAGASDASARLADAMDELDAILLTSLEELARVDEADMTGARAEALLVELWRTTFTAVATVQEAWLERAFVRRGAGIVQHIYPDSAERRRLYRYGMPPAVGRRFRAVARRMRELLAAADGYGSADPTTRVDLFEALGDLVSGDRGFGFRVRRTDTDEALLGRWSDVLGWWMNEPDVAGPPAEDLRSWQRFVADNLEFRLGVAIGAVVAEAWAEGTDDALTLPSLAAWKDTTRLPWVGFWARDLLRWGTHDPFVAFCLAQGLAPTREAAGERREAFHAWLEQELDDPTSEDRIDPQLFLRWQASLPRPEAAAHAAPQMRAALTGTTGERGRYVVMPVTRGEATAWLDPAGFELAVTPGRAPVGGRPSRSDFELVTAGGEAAVTRLFRPA